MAKITLWGFSGSTYVRTVRMLLAEKGVSDYEQVPVDVLKGEPKSEEHLTRHPFGKSIADHGVTRHWIAESRMEIDQARLLTLHAAHMMDTVGNKAARAEIAMIKVVAPNVACQVTDRAIQVCGGGGVSQEYHLAFAYAHSRTLRLADGPDEVHRETVAKVELKKHQGANMRGGAGMDRRAVA